jgi:hypothetical protein
MHCAVTRFRMICELRNAGIDPNMSVTARVSNTAKLNNRRSNGSHSRAGFVTGLIRLTTKGAAHHANAHPAAAASNAIHKLSSITSRTNRERPAPSDTRTAISRLRDSACAVIKFATLAQAISSTSAVNIASIHNDER